MQRKFAKESRREGVAIHPKAHKILMRRKSLPGQLSDARRRKPTKYSTQLREKQKVKRLYGLQEKQFRRLIKEAERSDGITGVVLLQFLERRIDNALYRLRLSTSRPAARQLVTHGHMLLNGRRVDVPSIRLKPGDELKLRPKSRKSPYWQDRQNALEEGAITASWIKLDKSKLTLKVTGIPQRQEAEPEINEQLIVEFYSR